MHTIKLVRHRTSPAGYVHRLVLPFALAAFLSACTDSDKQIAPINPVNGSPSQPANPSLPVQDMPVDAPDNPEQNPVPGGPGEPVDTPPQTGGLFAPTEHDLPYSNASYSEDGYGTKNVIRMDVRTQTIAGTCVKGDESGCTLDDVKADISGDDDFTVNIPVHMSADDYAQDGLEVNADMRQRGGSTRLAPQKSFKVKLDNKDALWRTERSMLLNKHPYENDRVRNKLSFDLMSDIPHLLSFRTQFVNLWIDDGQGPEDYGLFTHVESPGNRYLRRRGFDDDSRLYKVNRFNFSLEDLNSVSVDAEGKPLDKDLFERHLSIESGDDHQPLVNMLTALHDPAQSFESVLARYFNENNVLTWMTVNFLLHQTDAISHNYLLLNPAGSERFYFLPWDYDGGFAVEPDPPAGTSNAALQKRLFYGYARGIRNEFITRYYQRPGAHQRFIESAAFIRQNYLTDARVNEAATQYGQLVKPWLQREPDSVNNPNFNEYSVLSYAGFVKENEEILSTRYQMPMPSEIEQPPELINGQWVFEWLPAYDLTGQTLRYELLVSSTPQFEPDNLLVEVLDIEPNNTASGNSKISVGVDASLIPSGRLYARVIARPAQEPERFWQASNNRVQEDGVTWFGVYAFDAP